MSFGAESAMMSDCVAMGRKLEWESSFWCWRSGRHPGRSGSSYISLPICGTTATPLATPLCHYQYLKLCQMTETSPCRSKVSSEMLHDSTIDAEAT
jgi:hypothetical protein